MMPHKSAPRTTQPSPMPIGYWLKKVDRLLTERVDQIQAKNGISRLEWQTINTLFEKGPMTIKTLAESLAPFTNKAVLNERLIHFTEHDWIVIITEDTDTILYQLSPLGQQRRQEFLKVQQEIRQLARQHITAEAYTIVVQTLEQMAANLESSAQPEI